jgi:hypothetical protein
MTGSASGPLPASDASGDDQEVAVMARNGITCVPAYQYHVDGYRYTNLADALAQAGRRSPGDRDR